MEEKPKRKRGRPRRETPPDPNIQIWVRVTEEMKKALAEYSRRYSFTTDAEAIREMLRSRLRQEGLL